MVNELKVKGADKGLISCFGSWKELVVNGRRVRAYGDMTEESSLQCAFKDWGSVLTMFKGGSLLPIHLNLSPFY